MAHFSFYRIFLDIKYNLRDIFYENKRFFYLFLGLIILGLFIGVIAGFRTSSSASIGSLNDEILKNYLNGDTTLLGVFCSRIFWTTAAAILIFCTNFKPFCALFSMCFIFYKAFSLGSMCVLLVSLFKLGGVINLLVYLLPTSLILLCSLTFLAVICVSFNFACKNYGGSIFSREFFDINKLCLIVFGGGIFISLIIEIILLPFLSALLILG